MIQSNPKISVLMSVYNEKPEFLKKAVESILTQTFKDFEFIIINDSPHNTNLNQILKTYQDKDSRIVLIKNQENIGLTKSLNKGAKIAKGTYIARIDSDDIALPTRLEHQHLFMTQNPEVKLSGSWAEVINEKGKKIGFKKPATDYWQIKKRLIALNPFVHSTLIYEKKVFFEVGCYTEDMRLVQDYDLVLKTAAKYKIANLPEILIKYRDTSTNLSFSKMNVSLRFALKARFNALRYYGYPAWMAIYLTKPLISYIIPVPIKKIILENVRRIKQ